MATKNEKILASIFSAMISDLRKGEFDLPSVTEVDLASISAILKEPTEVPKSEKSDKKVIAKGYSYSGCNFVEMAEDKRYAHGICEFTASLDDVEVLHLYYHPNLKDMLQPIDPKDLTKGFIVCYSHKNRLAGKDGIRPYLKGLADMKRDNYDEFVERYTNRYASRIPVGDFFLGQKFELPKKDELAPVNDEAPKDNNAPVESPSVEECGF